MLVFIPTAGLGTRLEISTKYFNKCMIQIGSIPVLSHIIDSYPKNYKFVIAVGYKSEHIIEYCKIAYPKKRISFVKIQNFSGPKASLTYTIKKSLHKLNEPFFFHSNDSIITKEKIYKKNKKDTIYLSKSLPEPLKYRTASIIGSKVLKIYDKQDLKSEIFNYIGVAFIKNYKKFKKIIKKEKKNNGEVSYFQHLVNSKIQVNFSFVNQWIDIGDVKSKKIAEKIYSELNIMPKTDQGIFIKDNKVIKFFTNKKTINQRYERSKILNGLCPKIIKKTKFFYVYKYIKGNVLSNSQNKKKDLINLLDWSQNNLWKKYELSKDQKIHFNNTCHDFYYEKTLQRVNTFFEENNITDTKNIINGYYVSSIESIFKNINWKDISNGIAVGFHGDFHFENILKTKNNEFRLLDWRENFGLIKNYGDIYYDLAKLKHGFHLSHETMIRNGFNIKIEKDIINFDYLRKSSLIECDQILDEFIKNKNLSVKKINIIMQLIFLNIAKFYQYPYSHFLFYKGKLNLYKLAMGIEE